MNQKSTVPEVLPKVHAYRDAGNFCGGSLHIVLDEGNVHDDHVRHCIDRARENGDQAGVELGEILLRMSRTQRKVLCGRFYPPLRGGSTKIGGCDAQSSVS